MSALLFALLVPDPAGGPRAARRGRVADAIAIGVACGYGALMVVLGDATGPGARIPWQADVAIGVLCVLALPLRRRHPLGLGLVLLPLGAVSIMATGAIVAALFTVAVRFRPPVVLWLAAANIATCAGYFLVQQRPMYPLWADLLVRAVVTAAVVGWGLFVQAYRRLTQSLRDHATRLEAEQHLRVEQAKLTERTRIAREMHDVLAHRMSLISLHAGALEIRTDATAEETAIAAGAIRSSAHEALQELRTVFGALREGTVPARPEPPQPGLGDLPELVEAARASGTTVDYTCRVPSDGPAALLGRTAYRCVQEGLTNARKHAPGAAVRVLLDGAAGGELRVEVTNPCTGGDLAIPGAGLGLLGLRERIALAGGRVEHGVAEGMFRLQARLPWPG